MIDIHCHLTSARFKHDRDAVIQQASRRLEAVITSAIHPNEAEKVLRLCEKYPSFVHATLGLHPVYAAELTDEELEAYLNLIRRNRSKIVGIGETGLDYHWISDSIRIGKMKKVFIDFLQLARELDLPVVLHLRNAIDEGLDMVMKNKMREVVFHCFNGTTRQAEEITKNNYYVSIATNILRSENIQNVVSKVPLQRIVTETDSPYLGPRRKRNAPQNVSLVVDKLAELQGLSPTEVDEITSQNARKFFNIGSQNSFKTSAP